MTFRMRAASLLATIMLSLGLVGGAGAQQVDTTITLEDGEGCSATVVSTAFDFGTWMWDGTEGKYEKTTGGDGGTFVLNAINGAFGTTRIACNVQVTAGTMKNEAGDEIPNAIILADADNPTNSGNPLNLILTTGNSRGIEAELAPAFVQSMNTYGPGKYTGTITVTSASAGG